MVGYGCGSDDVIKNIDQFAISSINLRSRDVDKIIEKLSRIMKKGKGIFDES